MSVKEDIREMFKKEIHQAEEESFKRGIEEGREEGALEKLKTIVLNMLKKGHSIEEIADLLDIPLDEVKAIKE